LSSFEFRPKATLASIISAGGARPCALFASWLADLAKLGASFCMTVHFIIEAADCPAAEQLLLTIGRSGVLSSRAIAAGELETLLSLLGPLSERQRSDLQRATDMVLVEDCTLIYWPRTGEVFADAAYAMARLQATLA
jgi:hypothetical protein